MGSDELTFTYVLLGIALGVAGNYAFKYNEWFLSKISSKWREKQLLKQKDQDETALKIYQNERVCLEWYFWENRLRHSIATTEKQTQFLIILLGIISLGGTIYFVYVAPLFIAGIVFLTYCSTSDRRQADRVASVLYAANRLLESKEKNNDTPPMQDTSAQT